MTEKGLMETDRNNLERNHLFKDEDNLKGLHLESPTPAYAALKGIFFFGESCP